MTYPNAEIVPETVNGYTYHTVNVWESPTVYKSFRYKNKDAAEWLAWGINTHKRTSNG